MFILYEDTVPAHVLLKSSGLNALRHTLQAPVLLGGLPGSCFGACGAGAAGFSSGGGTGSDSTSVGISDGRGDIFVTVTNTRRVHNMNF